MQASPSEPEDDDDGIPGQALAVIAELLYLANLLLLPGLAFAVLLYLWWRKRASVPPVAAAHLNQTVSASLWAGVLLVIANGAVIIMGGYHGAHAWVVAIMWFTIFHSTLVLFGVFGLSKALSGQCWRYPLIGRPLPPDCPTADSRRR